MLPYLVTARVSISQQWLRKVALWNHLPYSAHAPPLVRSLVTTVSKLIGIVASIYGNVTALAI